MCITSSLKDVLALVLDLPLFDELLDPLIDLLELESPVCVVQEGPHIIAIVIARGGLEVHRGRHCGLFVSVERVVTEEMFYLFGHYLRG
jgi:hypothetical protein